MDSQEKQRLTDAIRGWVHMDNLLESHTAQATNARTLRAKYEKEAIAIMKQMHLDKSTIQISGASLVLQKRSTPNALSWTFLEKEISAWGLNPTQTQSLLKWLHEHRELKDTESLKKIGLKPPAS